MSTSILPTLPGVAWPVVRSPQWDTTIQKAISGKETRIARESYPRWTWTLSYNILRSAAAFAEYQNLVGFFNACLGQFDTFQYLDSIDNTVTGQQIAIGDGVTTVFQLVRSFGGFIEPVFAPNAVSGVYLNGIKQLSGVSNTAWGTANSQGPGVLIFTSPPANGVVITADFTYYWPCRFNMDSIELSQFLSGMHELKKLSLISVKN